MEVKSERWEGVNTDWTRLVHGTIQDSDQWNIPPAYRDNVNRSARMASHTGEKKNICICMSFTLPPLVGSKD